MQPTSTTGAEQLCHNQALAATRSCVALSACVAVSSCAKGLLWYVMLETTRHRWLWLLVMKRRGRQALRGDRDSVNFTMSLSRPAQVEALLGPKTEADLKPPERKKKPKVCVSCW